MIYVALLRGINVGGNNKVPMSLLRQIFENLGFTHVKTYINSGNVIFAADSLDVAALTSRIEQTIKETMGFEVPIVLRDLPTMKSTVATLPQEWSNDGAMKCDVLFLWQEVDLPNVVNELPVKPDIDTALYTPGAIIWSVDRHNATRSGLQKIIGTPLYKKVTIRNCNTVRKLTDLMESL